MPSGTAAQAVAEVVEALCQLFISALSRPHKAYHVTTAVCSGVVWRWHLAAMFADEFIDIRCLLALGAVARLRQPSTERPLCRPFETTKADMVALSACGINELHSTWWRSLTTQNGHMLLSVEPGGPGRYCVMYWTWTGLVAVVLAFTGAHSLKYITE